MCVRFAYNDLLNSNISLNQARVLDEGNSIARGIGMRRTKAATVRLAKDLSSVNLGYSFVGGHCWLKLHQNSAVGM